jgi:hypothetical protein
VAAPAAGGTGTTTTVSGSSTSATVSGLTDGTDYTVSVTAQNAYGSVTTGDDTAYQPVAAADAAATSGDAGDVVVDGEQPVVDTPVSQPVAGSSTSGYNTQVAPADTLNAPTAVTVYSGTPSNASAVTGVVTSSSTGDPLTGVTVTIAASDGTGSTTPTQTDSGGAFAFTGMPSASTGTNYNIEAVGGGGFGSYILANDSFLGGVPYQVNMAMTPSAQSYDESSAQAQTNSVATTNALITAYTSNTQVPPTIKVGSFPKNSACQQTSSSLQSVHTYPWRFYIQHVAAKEVGTFHYSGDAPAYRANVAAESDYAWYRRLHPDFSSFDIRDNTNDQCFDPTIAIPTVWNSWTDDPLAKRVVTSTGKIYNTGYQAGQYTCGDHPLGNQLSQNGSLARVHICGVTDWHSLIAFYYPGKSVKTTTAPPPPSTTYSRPSGAVTLHFPAQVSGVNVGWNYEVDAYVTTVDSNGVPHLSWKKIYGSGFNWNAEAISTSYTYHTAACQKYRALSTNIAGTSAWKPFASGYPICAG